MPKRILRVAKDLSSIPWVRLLSWVLLAACVAVTVQGPPEWALALVEAGTLRAGWLLAPAVVFGAFIVGFVYYRFTLVRAGRYNPGKAFVQVGFAVLVFTLLLPENLSRFREHRPGAPAPVNALPFLESPDPAARALACEALAGRGRVEAAPLARARALATGDADPRVQAACAWAR